MYKLLYCLIVSFLLFQSCTIKNDIHFNKDWSGESVTELNISKLLDFAKAMEEEENQSEDFDEMFQLLNKNSRPDSMQHAIDSINMELAKVGISNFDFFTNEKNALGMEFNFESIEALNKTTTDKLFKNLSDEKIQGQSEEFSMLDGINDVQYKVIEKKNLIINLSGDYSYEILIQDTMNAESENPDQIPLTTEEAEQALEMSIGMIGSMLTFENNFSFDRKIKSVESPLPVVFKKNGKNLVVKYTLAEYIETLKNNDKVELVIKLR